MNFNFRNLCDFLFAKRCKICGEMNEENNLCFSCFSSLKHLVLGCKKCQQPLSYVGKEIDVCSVCIDKDYSFFDEMISAFIYNEFLKKHIIKLKNNNDFYLSDVFCSFLVKKIKHMVNSSFIIAPIPLHSLKLYKRGYNQSLILAKSVAKQAKIICIHDLFERTKNTYTQANKTQKERETNVKDAFIFNKKYKLFIKDKTILIIDDIITTGATIFECAKTLKNIQNKGIKLLSIGRRIK
ncbi:ComF family protein [Alphaproteobacteria bacterium endosymbiont of Tiliacea citrago]|uniref:ComF family protein n=1 Tax=Alphaproteobacteria bacterium endosymbiont of Tiliacea citrago TaxID=3077944 RepID=UPI00313EEABB